VSTFVLIPGAGGMASYWHRVVPLLEEAGHEALAVDLPGDDERKGIHAYADLVAEVIGRRAHVVLVAQSLGGFTAALVASRVPVESIVFVNAMIPMPGETAGAWWGNTQSSEAREAAARRGGYPSAFDVDTYFMHDVPPDIVAASAEHQRAEAKIVFTEPATFERWPAVPMLVVIGADDRFFPRDFQVRVARERLGADVPITEIPGGHLVALSQPHELAKVLLQRTTSSP
jgi:pimeloyl-ACP methyl ester carboxylesterase